MASGRSSRFDLYADSRDGAGDVHGQSAVTPIVSSALPAVTSGVPRVTGWSYDAETHTVVVSTTPRSVHDRETILLRFPTERPHRDQG